MTTWFIRLGSKKYINDMNLYQALAREYSIIKIGYAIDRDITDKKNKDEIKKYIEKHLKKYLETIGAKTSPRAISRRAGLINTFINDVVNNDKVISPSWENPKKYRVGKVVSKKCDTVE